ncbi:hypothetical protein STEG23_017226 [Scotinomys teguina]
MLRGVGRTGPFCQTLRVSEVHRSSHTSPSPSPKSSLKGRSCSAPDIPQPPECRKRGIRDAYLRPGRVLGSQA